MPFNKNILRKKGFTLVELLVVISIIGILSIITLASFTNAQKKGRDVKRKAELNAVSNALMMYYNDKGLFPPSITFNSTAGFTGPSGDVLMVTTPTDPKASNPQYLYEVSPSLKSYNLFASLENTSDPECRNTGGFPKLRGAGDADSYCYGIASPNTSPGTTLP